MSELNLQAEVNRPYRESGNILKVGYSRIKRTPTIRKAKKRYLGTFLISFGLGGFWGWERIIVSELNFQAEVNHPYCSGIVNLAT